MTYSFGAEPDAEMRADDLELAVEVVGRLLVAVHHLTEDLLIVVDHVGAKDLTAGLAYNCPKLQALQHHVGQLDLLMVRVEWRKNTDGALVHPLHRSTNHCVRFVTSL